MAKTRTITVTLGQLRDNPTRNFKHHTIDFEKIGRILSNMRSHGLFHNLLVRPHPRLPEVYQLAFGHHRLRAALALFGPECETVVQCGDYSDRDLVLLQLHENIACRNPDNPEWDKLQAIAAAIRVMRAAHGIHGPVTSKLTPGEKRLSEYGGLHPDDRPEPSVAMAGAELYGISAASLIEFFAPAIGEEEMHSVLAAMAARKVIGAVEPMDVRD
jgi:hypothetical protein